MINDMNYYPVKAWMSTNLGLKGAQRDIYGIIYNYSIKPGQYFWGSTNYLAEFTNNTESGARKALDKLIKAGLIEKKVIKNGNQNHTVYRACKPDMPSSKSIVPDSESVIVFGWMINKLELKGLQKDLYALIYKYSQDGVSPFIESLAYMSQFTSSTKYGAQKAIKELLDKNYITKFERYENNIKYCSYKVNLEYVPYATESDGYATEYEKGMQLSPKGMQLSPTGYATQSEKGMQLSPTNNIKINNINYICPDLKKSVQNPSFDEALNFCKKNNLVRDVRAWYEYYSKRGFWHDWKRSLVKWIDRRSSSNNFNEMMTQDIIDWDAYEKAILDN